jgi:hypothetical protein
METSVASSDFHRSTNQNLQDNKPCSVELDGLFYEFTRAGSMQCVIRRLNTDFPRNFIYCGGSMFRVSLLHISTSAVAIVNILVLPRLLGQIGDENNPHSKGSLKSIQFIAFEFKSEICEIGAISFTSSPSLTLYSFLSH